MSTPRVPQPLRTVLREEGLSFKDVERLCPSNARVGDQSIADIAGGKRKGSDRSRQRILNALNGRPEKTKVYAWGDLFREPPDDAYPGD